MLRPAEISELDILAHRIVENVLSSSIRMFYSSLIPVTLSTQNSIHSIEGNPTNDVEVNVRNEKQFLKCLVSSWVYFFIFQIPIENPDVMLRMEELTAIDILATEIVENALSSGIQIFCSTAFSENSLSVTATVGSVDFFVSFHVINCVPTLEIAPGGEIATSYPCARIFE